jgi:uncharacterized OsmC-like protein
MYRAEVTHKEDLSFEAACEGHSFKIDAKARDGVTPPAALLASLASCAGVYIRKYAESAKLDLGDFKVIAEAEFTKDPPLCFKSISLARDLKNAQLDERRHKAIVEFIKNCPVHNTLKSNPGVEVKII